MPMIDLTALIDGFYDAPNPPCNPVAQQAEDDAIAWLRRVGVITTVRQEQHLRSFRFGLYHGIATPRVDRASLVLGMKWFCWGSLADDQYDNYDWGERHRRMRAVLDEMCRIISGDSNCGRHVNPVIAGFADFWPELTAGMPPRQLQRITTHFLDYMRSITVQNRYHESGAIPDLATFISMRRNTIAMIFQTDVLEVVSGLRVPDIIRDDALYRELVCCFADITAWHNDLYGLEKDIADGQTCNMVRVVAASERCSLTTAARMVLDRAKQRQETLLSIEHRLPALTRDLGLPVDSLYQATRLAQDLRAYVYANLVWIHETHRYDLDRPRIRGTFDDLITTECQP